jgi:chromosome partitioning protein
MARRVAVASQKGGVGKTTIALNLAVAWAEKGCPTLLVDVDPQGGVGLALAKGDTELQGLAELVMKQIDPSQAVLQTQLPALRLLARGRLDPTDVAGYEQELAAPGALAKVFEAVEGAAELVVIDSPSGLGRITRALLALSNYVLLPFQSETLALRSVVQSLRVIEHVQVNENPDLRLVGMLPTMVEKDSPAALGVLAEIWSGFPAALETIIPRAPVFGHASASGVPVSFLAGATAPEARRFQLLADELAAQMDRLEGKEVADEAKPARSLL